jgi:DNA-binding GntR family transcriptional regulator
MTQIAQKYRTMTEIVADELRVKILNGDLIPGQRLVTADIADEMGVSRMPVRDALRYLESTGLVETVPHRGTVVKDLSENEIVELYQIRAVLEGLAARLASKRVGEAQLRQFENIVAKHDLKTMQNEGYDEFTKLNKSFHSMIWASAGSPKLESMLANLYDACSQYRNLSMLVPGRSDSIYNEHNALCEAIKCHDCDEAERLARTHYENTSLALIAAIESRKKPTGDEITPAGRKNGSKPQTGNQKKNNSSAKRD